MARKIKVHSPKDIVKFTIGNREVTVSDKMSLADADAVNKQYPGVYLDIIDAPEQSSEPVEKSELADKEETSTARPKKVA